MAPARLQRLWNHEFIATENVVEAVMQNGRLSGVRLIQIALTAFTDIRAQRRCQRRHSGHAAASPWRRNHGVT